MKLVIIKFYRILFACLIIVAIGVEIFAYKNSLVNFFSYFTVISSLLVAIGFILSIVGSFNTKHTDFLRGAGTVYVLLTAIGFIFLLGGKNDELIPWVSIILHYIVPLIAIFDWIFSPSLRLTFKNTIWWFVFLLCYLVCSLIRGNNTQWYPYPFLDPKTVGINGLVGYIIGFSLLSIILIVIIQKLSERNRKG